MAETPASATTNEAITSLRSTTDHHTKELQEMRTIQEIDTHTLNEMSQQLTTILQKLSSLDQGGSFQSPRIGENQSPNSSLLHMSRPMRLEFPKFSGEEPASWMYKANQYFRYYNTPIGEKLMLASFHMEGEALIWFQESEETGVFYDWESLVQAMQVRFGIIAHDDLMKMLTRLRQTAIVAMYKAQFEVLSNRIKGLSPAHKLSCFLSGLKDEIRLLVCMLNPQ